MSELSEVFEPKWGFARRLEEAQSAWGLYSKVMSNPASVPPALFSAGFTMGVAAAQKDAGS